MDLLSKLTSKDNKYACALTDKIISESQKSDEWYIYFDVFASLLNHPKSLVRNRAINLIATNIQWDDEKKFDLIISDFLCHITDEKPITARQCIKALGKIGQTKKEYIPMILSALQHADLTKYRDSMRSLIERDIEQTKQILTNLNLLNEFEKEIAEITNLGIKSNPLRLTYENEVRTLCDLPNQLKMEGYSEEQIAQIMHTKRRELGRKFKEAAPPLFRKYIYTATAAKYGDPLGPTFEMLKEKKSYEQIIESASRPIDDLDNRLTIEGFREWYKSLQKT